MLPNPKNKFTKFQVLSWKTSNLWSWFEERRQSRQWGEYCRWWWWRERGGLRTNWLSWTPCSAPSWHVWSEDSTVCVLIKHLERERDVGESYNRRSDRSKCWRDARRLFRCFSLQPPDYFVSLFNFLNRRKTKQIYRILLAHKIAHYQHIHLFVKTTTTFRNGSLPVSLQPTFKAFFML